MSVCQRDNSPTGDGATLCQSCTEKVTEALSDLAELLPMLADSAAKMTAQGSRTGTIKRTGHSDGISVHALDVADEVRAVVTPWVRLLVEEQVLSPDAIPERLDNGPADTGALCGYLASRMPLVRLAETAGDFAADVLDPGQSLCLGYNDDGVPDMADYWPPGEFVLSQRPPLVPLVKQVVDAGKSDGMPTDKKVLASAIADEWWSLADLVEILPRLVPHGTKPPTLRTLQRWAYGSPAVEGKPATAKRKAQPARAAVVAQLMVHNDTVRVGSVVSLVLGRLDSEAA